ncbi:hypothetical protein [Allokutzneria oryzae]|uniref:PH domain-containing protein n=1 Tax=Allokutzneria oryzae TaxID=1378989 RepID=A0ABV6A5I8_9PSEU
MGSEAEAETETEAARWCRDVQETTEDLSRQSSGAALTPVSSS